VCVANKFATYLTNILHLLLTIFVVTTEKNKYLLSANNLRSLYLQINLRHRISARNKLFLFVQHVRITPVIL